MKTKTKVKARGLLAVLLGFALVLGLVPGVAETALAESTVTWEEEDLRGIYIGPGEGEEVKGIAVRLEGDACRFAHGSLILEEGASCVFASSQQAISGIRIELMGGDIGGSLSEDWDYDGDALTWSGDPSGEVRLGTDDMLYVGIQQIEFTLGGSGGGVKTSWKNETVQVDGEVELDRRVKVTGDVVLVLNEGSKLVAKKGINVPQGSSLTIEGSGELVARVDGDAQHDWDSAGIGGNSKETAGTITVRGGTISATGGINAAAIGGGSNASGGTVRIEGGTVTATGTDWGAGIGGGAGGAGGDVTITGGDVTAFGGGIGGAGIGKGAYGDGGDGTVTIGGAGLIVMAGSDEASAQPVNDFESSHAQRWVRVGSDFPVTGVTLDPAEASLAAGETQELTAAVAPGYATDKSVVWGVEGNAVTLYSDSACESPLAPGEPTEALTVYARGVSGGTATVTVASSADATVSATCVVTVEGPAVAKVMTANLTLGGELGLNFYLDVPDGLAEGARAAMDGPNGEMEVELASAKEEDGRYKVSYPVSAIKADQDVTLALLGADQQPIPLFNSRGVELEGDVATYSVYRYLQAALADGSGLTEGERAQVRATYTYCAYAARWKYGTALPTEGINALPGQEEVSAAVAAHGATQSGTAPDGVKVTGVTLLLDSDTSLRLYFTCDGGAALPGVTLDGKEVQPVQLPGTSKYYVEAGPIGVSRLGRRYSVRFGDEYEVQVCALSYVRSALRSAGSSQELRDVCRALWAYGEAFATE